MFHTFEGFENPAARANNGSNSSTGKNNVRSRSNDRQSANRRASTVRACEQCRRRKIRCDGEQPCEACQWYKKSDLCHYSDPRPSRRHVEKLSTTLDEYRTLLDRLFPSTSPESLLNLPRERLLELIAEGRPQKPPSPATSPAVESHVSPLAPEDENLESLQTMPEESGDSRDSVTSDIVSGVSDDVNALSLSVKQPSSYLGISSIMAVLRVIVWVDPGSITYFSRTPPQEHRQSRDPTYPNEAHLWARQQHQQQKDQQSQQQHNQPSQQPPSSIPEQQQRQQQRISSTQTHTPPNGLQMINAYFAYFHAFIPLIDEADFRETYLSGRRTDSRWLALLYMVFALGSVAAYTADDTTHEFYYHRAKNYTDLDTLASSHLETVQALGLMGGYYLHYVSQPNLAYSLMGAALRMAASLGLHREFVDNRANASKQNVSFSLDLRRRVWWSLFCMDTFGGMTLGRPTMGRWGHAITIRLPQYNSERENALSVLPLVENIRFCKIATQVQDALAIAPLVNYSDMISLDNQLVEWYQNLPPLLKTHEPCPDTISTTRTIMRWRYQSQRILLHRPALLSYAMRRIPYVAIRSEERSAIEKCRAVADETIRDISSATRLNQMSGWNAVWFIFQATMVPLLGLFIADNTAIDATATVEACRTQVEIAMIALARMEAWSPTAKRTLEVVSRIFEASKRGPDAGDTSSTSNSSNGVRTVDTNTPFPHPTHTIPSSIQSAPDLGRGPAINNEHLFHNGLNPNPFVDDPTTQNMWDYITWSDSSLWPGFADIQVRNDGLSIFNPDEDEQKTTNQAGIGLGDMYDNSFLSSNSIPFQ